MPAERNLEHSLSGFSKLSRHSRFRRLIELGFLTHEAAKSLRKTAGLSFELAEHLIENVIGYYPLPMGVATHFRINQRDYVIPMAVEETSIIAAASKTAKWIRQNGQITTHTEGNYVIGQIQLAKVSDYPEFKKTLLSRSERLIGIANREVAHGLVQRGGGVKKIEVRAIERADGHFMAVVHLYVDPCDAMGANIVNQVCEFLKPHIELITGETVSMCILSNLVDSRLTHAEVVLEHIDADLCYAIQEASYFAESDPYRAATHNKGVLNGIDPIIIATGNDWRAVEAGIHAYAAREGVYRPITTWRFEEKKLVGRFKAPIIVGTVGGVTRLHPTAQIALHMLQTTRAHELAEVMGAVGLTQNLGALRALCTEGIIQGHMKLHIANLTLSAGAVAGEIPILKKRLEDILKKTRRITMSHALQILQELRGKRPIEEPIA